MPRSFFPSRAMRQARPGSRPLATGAALLACALLNPAQAEDIDIYAGSGGGGANVLFLLDNTSNWSANNQAWIKDSTSSKTGAIERCNGDQACIADTNAIFGSDTSLAQGQVEVRSLRRVIDSVVCTTDTTKKLNVNVGIMAINPTKGTVANPTYTSNSWVGGVVLNGVAPATDAHCAALRTTLAALDNVNDSRYKTSGAANYEGPLFEVFKYFGGHTNPVGARTGIAGSPAEPARFGAQRFTLLQDIDDPAAFTDSTRLVYRSPSAACEAKNFLVLVGNSYPNAGETSSSTSAPAVYDRMLRSLGYTESAVSNSRYADEWTQFLANTDVNAAAGVQNVVTYTLNVYNNAEDTAQTALLKSMADVGGAGRAGYFEVGGNVGAMISAFADIFTSISAVNSVFASASLPVSVNTQGTYLNQVFMGMFRPDTEARPRWAGNLKQYKFGVASGGGLFLADRDGRAALNAGNTGFIDACRSSFWTSDSSPYWGNVPLEQTPATGCLTAPASAATSDQPDGDIVEKGGAAQRLRAMSPASRVLRTCTSVDCSSLVAATDANLETLATNLGLPIVSGSNRLASGLAGWIRGENSGDGPRSDTGWRTYGSLGASAARPTLHGDVVHSRPLAVNYGSSSSDSVVVYYGAGDGWLRAVDGRQSGTGAGDELWAFFAPEFLPRMNRLRENSQLVAFPTVTAADKAPKDYFFDGTIGAYMERSTSAVSKLYLYPTMRRGGRMVYAFDATSRPVATNATTLPTLKWKFGCPSRSSDAGCTSGATSMGQSWSTPRPFRVKGSDTIYLVFGGGYDTCEDTDSCGSSTKGRGLFILNADTGALVSHIDLSALSTEAGRVIADVVPVDVNGDGFADLLYAADTRGNLWRVNLSNRDAANPYTGWTASEWGSKTYRIGKVGNWSGSAWTQKRKFQYAPDVVVLGDTAWVLIGSGDREQPLAGANASKVKNRFYGFKDNLTVGGRSSTSTTPALIDDSNDCDAAGNNTLGGNCKLLNVTTLDLDYRPALADAGTRGWVIDLTSGAEPYEHVITTPVTVGGYVYFSTYQAKSSENQCSVSLGTSRGYAVSFLDGSKRAGDPARAAEFRGGGFAPSPVAGIVEIGDKKHTFLLGGRDSASFLEVAPPEVLVGTRRRKLYRYQTIDSQ